MAWPLMVWYDKNVSYHTTSIQSPPFQVFSPLPSMVQSWALEGRGLNANHKLPSLFLAGAVPLGDYNLRQVFKKYNML